jgi:hypothetical protein
MFCERRQYYFSVEKAADPNLLVQGGQLYSAFLGLALKNCRQWTDQGTLTEGEGTVQLTSLFRSAAFSDANIIYFLDKPSYLNEEVNSTGHSPLVSVP